MGKNKNKIKGPVSAHKTHNTDVSEQVEEAVPLSSGLVVNVASKAANQMLVALAESSEAGGPDIASSSAAEVASESECLEDCSEGEEEEESLADSEGTSRTLGEYDSDSTQAVCKNASEKMEANKRGNAAAKTQPKNPWATRSAVSLFAGNRKPENGLKLQQIEVGDGPIKFNAEDLPKDDDWNFCLVGYFGGRFPGKKATQQLVTSWKEEVNIHYHSSGWIVFQFDNQEARDNTLQGGPYMVFGRPLLLKILPEYFTFNYEELSCFPVWIQFQNLPIELWCEYALSRLCAKIGKPIFADKLTAHKDRISFARVLVEVDVAKPIIQQIDIIMPNGDAHSQGVLYENLPLFCTHCKSISHSTKNCKVLENFAANRNKDQQANVSATNAGNVIQPSSSIAAKSKDTQREWVTKKPKASTIQASNKPVDKETEIISKNKFSLLEIPEAEGVKSQTTETAQADLQIQKLASQQQVQVEGAINAEQVNQLSRGEEQKRRQQQLNNPSPGPSDAQKRNTKQTVKLSIGVQSQNIETAQTDLQIQELASQQQVQVEGAINAEQVQLSRGGEQERGQQQINNPCPGPSDAQKRNTKQTVKSSIINTAAMSIIKPGKIAKPTTSNTAATSIIKTRTVASSSIPIPPMAKGEEGRKKRDKQNVGKPGKISFEEFVADLGGDSPIPNSQ